jgi:hypothetical protein
MERMILDIMGMHNRDEMPTAWRFLEWKLQSKPFDRANNRPEYGREGVVLNKSLESRVKRFVQYNER